jgi:hypothetical protein
VGVVFSREAGAVRVVAAAVVLALLASGCGDGGSDLVADGLSTSTSASASTTTTASTTTSPESITIEPTGDRGLAAAEFLNMQWSTVEIWGDGWVELSVTAAGPPVIARDSEIGRLFSDEVHDAIEAAGATDMVAAYGAVTSAGLVSEVLEVLDEHPEVWDAIYGPGTLAMTAAVTVDGSAWETSGVPFPGTGQLLASASDGTRIAVVLGERDAYQVRLAVTSDLENWSVATLPTPFEVGIGQYQVVPVPGGRWLLTASDSEEGTARSVWVVSDDASATEVVLPGDGSCCGIEATSAGVFAYAGNFGESSSAWFSSDGLDWEPRGVPDGERIVNAASVQGGVVISVRDDELGTTTQWRGTPDGREWTPTELPEEIEWELSVLDNNHEGIAQFVAVPGWGQRGYQPPIPAASFTLDHDGFRFDATIGASTERSFAVTVTDVGTGEVVFDRAGPIEGMLPAWARTSGTDLELSDPDGVVVSSVPLQPFEEAYNRALADERAAEDAARGPVEQAFLDSTYLLYSLDGITWSSMIIDRAGGSFSPWLAASINGDRALIGNDDDGYRVFELVAG